MQLSVKKGLGFGLTSGIITTLGLLIGLYASTGSKLAIIGGILVIAIADSMSDALGIHISEESDTRQTHKSVWTATLATFGSKLFFSGTFVVPILFLNLRSAVIVSIIWGLSLIALFSHYLAKQQKIMPYKTITEHLTIAIIVITLTYGVGILVGHFFS